MPTTNTFYLIFALFLLILLRSFLSFFLFVRPICFPCVTLLYKSKTADKYKWDFWWTTQFQAKRVALHAPRSDHPRLFLRCGFFIKYKCALAAYLRELRRTLPAAAREAGALAAHLPAFRWREPTERAELRQLYAAAKANTVWVQKPCSSSFGKGITFVARERGDALPPEPAEGEEAPDLVFQLGVQRPMVLLDHRFHLRVYVLVASWHPLRVLMYDEALVFSAAKALSTADASGNDRLALLSNHHVSNYSPDRRASWFFATQMSPANATEFRRRLRRTMIT